MSATPTYVFRDGVTYGMVGGEVVASSSDPDEARLLVEAELAEVERKPKKDATGSKTHVVTPNGLVGEVLGRHTVWPDEITVRFNNGTITTIAAAGVKPAPVEKTASDQDVNPIVKLEKRLTEGLAIEGLSRSGIEQRLSELEDLAREIEATRPGNDKTADFLQQLKLGARYETAQLKQALEEAERQEADALDPGAPYGIDVAPAQPSLGDGDGQWIQDAYQQVVDEASQVDWDEVLREDPKVLVESLGEGQLDAETVRDVALSHIQSRTAAIDSNVLPKYHEAFVVRAEQARQERLARDPEPEPQRHEASKEDPDVPPEALFL